MEKIRMTSYIWVSKSGGGRVSDSTPGKCPNMVFYRATEVDAERAALLAAVRELVEAAIGARELMETLPTLYGFIGLAVLEELKQAIAAVERLIPKEVDGGKD